MRPVGCVHICMISVCCSRNIQPDASLFHIGHFQAVDPQLISGLTRNLAFLVPSIKEEITLALNSAIPTTSEASMGMPSICPCGNEMFKYAQDGKS